ncbi:hypothetical protein CWS02_13485 [Enterobacter sp. EA-1]|nr:hypothetical protein CWS02_13485 [Enterobacter sp. EA-1]
MKDDRDAHFMETNTAGVPVNRWLSTGMLCASAASNETGMLTQKFVRALGMLAVDNRCSRLTRTNGSKSCSNIWSRCDDQPLG